MSQKPIAQKLLLKPGYKVLVINSPTNYIPKLRKQEASILTDPKSQPFDLIQAFVSTKKELQGQLQTLKPLPKEKGLLWVTYPKGKSEINRDSIREYAAAIGLQTVSLVAVDDKWSVLRMKIV